MWVRPKVRIDRLLFLLGYAITPRGWRDEDVAVAAVDDLVPAVARALCRQTERAVLTGLLQGYRVHEDAMPVLRGRLRETDQMRRRHGLAVPLEVRYDEFTVDIAENRILRTPQSGCCGYPAWVPSRDAGCATCSAASPDVNPLAAGQSG